MPGATPPAATAAWRHVGAREGAEVLVVTADDDGRLLEGHVSAVEDGRAWGVRYSIAVDATGATRRARVVTLSAAGERELLLEGDGAGGWRVDGRPAPALAGCIDVDLEAAAATNSLPIRRLRLEVGARAAAPAVWVRVPGPAVERLEQEYLRLADEGRGARRYDYSAPDLGFRTTIACDADGLVIDYPGIAIRIA